MKANYEDKIKPQAQVDMGNLYDMNKQIMLQSPEIDVESVETTKTALVQWLKDYVAQRYFMMLCHERRDYTVFAFRNSYSEVSIGQAQSMAADVIECLTNRGMLLSCELQPDNVWEIWIRVEDECFVYYLFPYGEAVLEY